MKLFYTNMARMERAGKQYHGPAADGMEVLVDDVVEIDTDEKCVVLHIQLPHKPSSTGRVHVRHLGNGWDSQYFPGVIGAEWRGRTDQG